MSVGQPLRRKEDRRLLTGAGTYSDDVHLPGEAHAVMVRTPHAHARIVSIDAAEALAMPGVLAVLTGHDARADGLQPTVHLVDPKMPPDVPLANRDGSPFFASRELPLPPERARHVGEAVAMVIAGTLGEARDAAERVRVEYEPLPATTASVPSTAPGAPRVWEETANVCLDADAGDRAATDAAFAHAAHVARFSTQIQRTTGVPMEPRAALGAWDPLTGRYTVFSSSGGVGRHKKEIAHVLGVPEASVRVVVRDMGGNFGTRNSPYVEYVLVAWASKRVGRPVKWTADRQECFLSDYQGRDLHSEAELAMDAEGRFLAVRGSNLSNLGAYTHSVTALRKGVEIMTSIYRVPAAFFRARAVLSNTPSTHPLRSAGRPEAMYIVERLIDLAAREHGFDRAELRRMNLIRAEAMPYLNPFGMKYDSGDYVAVMDRALDLSDWKGYPARRAETQKRGRLRGIGIANYIEVTTGSPRERSEITVLPEGRITVTTGCQASGQGHETSFAQLVAECLGARVEDIELIAGDSDRLSVAEGSFSGRSMRYASIVMSRASAEIVSRGKRIASHVLEASEADIEFARGRFSVAGTDRGMTLYEVAKAAAGGDVPEALSGPLAAASEVNERLSSFPHGCHVCEVEVDPETGTVDLVRYAAVDDVGRAVNPMILDGQTHGGIVHGVGQALLEECVYDPESGQMLSASFMDYAMPRADTVPSFATRLSEVPASSHPLGIRSGGEGGTTPALGVVINAIVDALWERGVRHVEMPATPEKVWRALQE